MHAHGSFFVDVYFNSNFKKVIQKNVSLDTKADRGVVVNKFHPILFSDEVTFDITHGTVDEHGSFVES